MLLTGQHHRRRSADRRLLIVAATLLIAAAPSSVLACSIDGIASISANGILAVRTTDAPTAATVAHWAPFTFGLAYAPGDVVRLSEDFGKLRRTLPAATLAVPFQWSFGDGRVARGAQAAIRYTRTGWYRITVRGLWPSRHSWVLFDSAKLHVVPAGALWQANIGYRLVLALESFTRVLAYGGGVAIILVPIGWRAWRVRRRRLRRS